VGLILTLVDVNAVATRCIKLVARLAAALVVSNGVFAVFNVGAAGNDAIILAFIDIETFSYVTTIVSNRSKAFITVASHCRIWHDSTVSVVDTNRALNARVRTDNIDANLCGVANCRIVALIDVDATRCRVTFKAWPALAFCGTDQAVFDHAICIFATVGITVKRARKTDVENTNLPVADVVVVTLAVITAEIVCTLSIDITRICCEFSAFVDIDTVELAGSDVEFSLEAESARTGVAAKSVVADLGDRITIVLCWNNIFTLVVVLAGHTAIGMDHGHQTVITAAFKPSTVISRAAVLLS
jgi:hypothetical protein